MLSSKEISMLIEATGTSVYMTLASTLMAYVIGLPIGILLVVCAPGGLKPKAVLYKILDFIVNITRSIPFLILMLLATPLARLVTGKSYGANATIISLTLAAAPFIARLVESSLLEVDKGVIEAAQSMGASIWQIVFKVLIGEARVSLIVGSTIALGTVLGYTAMSGAIGGGGLGDPLRLFQMGYQNPSGDGCTACYSDADHSDCRQPFIQETGQKTDPLRGRIFCLVIEWFRIPENPAERGEYYEKKSTGTGMHTGTERRSAGRLRQQHRYYCRSREHCSSC